MYSNFEPIDKLCLVQVAYGAAAGWDKHSRLLHSSRILILARLFFCYRYIRSMFVIIAIVVIMTKKVQKNLYVIVCVSLYFLFSFTAAAPCEHQSLICGVTNHAA